MENNIIKLNFDQTITGLAGNDYGYEEYKKQIKERFDYNKSNTIIFPEQIRKVAISFVQGMFREILEQIDKNDIEKYVTIKSSSKQLTDKILNNIKF
ncbi:MAG: hypothetical protein HFJ24_05565 [Clostridia bacterium]|nr:hypothetical protein [Clostridia bacterium]